MLHIVTQLIPLSRCCHWTDAINGEIRDCHQTVSALAKCKMSFRNLLLTYLLTGQNMEVDSDPGAGSNLERPV